MKEDLPVKLEELGWNAYFQGRFESLKLPECVPARVISVEKHSCRVLSNRGELTAAISGKLHYRARGDDQYPVVGDWVAISLHDKGKKGVIHAILPRKSRFSRQAPGGRQRLSGGKTEEQVVAANVDTVFIVSGMDGGRNLNLRSIERYLTIAKVSGARPVIVLNKADLCTDIESRVRDVQQVASNTAVHAVSAREGRGIDSLRKYITRGSTAALLGLSGVGKSAIINALLGTERQATGAVRDIDHRGRHTTTRRELILLSGGGAVVDNPGMREIQVWSDEGNLDDAFEDIRRLAGQCRFSDCQHGDEPGCAIREAIRRGELDNARFRNYQKLRRELRHLAARRDNLASVEEKAKWKRISRLAKQMRKNKK